MRAWRKSPLLFLVVVVMHARSGAGIGIFPRGYGANSQPPPPSRHAAAGADPLILSDMLQSGKSAEEIQDAAAVDMGGRKTFAGFFQTDADKDRNMFFWFFPAMNGNKAAPLIIWLQGGPGGSSMFGLFAEIGPWGLTRAADGSVKLEPRKITWNKNYSLLFIDNPVGAGFSYTTRADGYCKTEEEVAAGLYSTLTQFYKVFEAQRSVDLYLAGESYAGHYLPAFAFHIVHLNPSLPPSARVPLKGVAIGDGWVDPINMLPAYPSMLLGMGLVGLKEAAVFESYTERVIAAIQADQMELAFRIWDEMMNGDLTPYKSYFFNVTGSTDYFNFLNTAMPADVDLYAEFLQQAWVRSALHVGSVPFGVNASDCEVNLVKDFMRSMRPELQGVVHHIKVLVYSGNLDIIIGSALTERFVSQLSFPGSDAFHASPRRKFSTGGSKEVSGYVRHSKSFTQAVVRNAGHLLPHDQPERAMDLITRFVESDEGWCDCPPCDGEGCCPAHVCTVSC